MQKFIECTTRYQAKKAATWAAKIVKVDGGFMAFEFISEWENWKNQK